MQKKISPGIIYVLAEASIIKRHILSCLTLPFLLKGNVKKLQLRVPLLRPPCAPTSP